MDLLSDFVLDCQARGLTKHTIETYRSCVQDFLHHHPDPAAVRLEDLRAYLDSLRARRLDGSTLKGYLYSLSSFYNYLVFYGAMQSNPILGFKRRYLSRVRLQVGEHTRQLISIQDMQFLVSAAANIQEIAIVMMLAKTGMRRGELLDLSVRDIDLAKGNIRVPPKAKRSQLRAFMDEELRAVLQQYLAWRKKRAKSEWLWISKRGGKIHKDLPGRIIARLGEKLGKHDPGGALEDKLTPHCFRHWFTTWLFRAHMNTDYIKWLRGDSLREDSWQWYNHIDPEEVRQEYLRCMPKLLDHSLKSYDKQGSNS